MDEDPESIDRIARNSPKRAVLRALCAVDIELVIARTSHVPTATVSIDRIVMLRFAGFPSP